jgi:hypothetical protein
VPRMLDSHTDYGRPPAAGMTANSFGDDHAAAVIDQQPCPLCGVTSTAYGVRTRPMCSAARRSSAGTPSV